jgi:hypothetical protein
MSVNVLAIGLDPQIATQLERLRELGYYVEGCLIDAADSPLEVTRLHLESRTFDCVLFDAGLRAPAQLQLFEKLINLVHERAPLAKICFNTGTADSAEAVQRWA